MQRKTLVTVSSETCFNHSHSMFMYGLSVTMATAACFKSHRMPWLKRNCAILLNWCLNRLWAIKSWVFFFMLQSNSGKNKKIQKHILQSVVSSTRLGVPQRTTVSSTSIRCFQNLLQPRNKSSVCFLLRFSEFLTCAAWPSISEDKVRVKVVHHIFPVSVKRRVSLGNMVEVWFHSNAGRRIIGAGSRTEEQIASPFCKKSVYTINTFKIGGELFCFQTEMSSL